jgi:hypothetical protein
VAGTGSLKKKTPPDKRGEMRRVARNNASTRTPPNVVIEAVDVHVPLAVVGVPVHVHNRDALCTHPSTPPPIEYSPGCILLGI